MTMVEFVNPGFMHFAESKSLSRTPTPTSPSADYGTTLKNNTSSTCFDCAAEPCNQPRSQNKTNPTVSRITIPCNCGGDGWNTCAHHCAKLFQLEVEIKGLISKPVVEIPKKRDFEGDYKSKPGRLQSKMTFYSRSGAQKETLLNLGVATVMTGAAESADPQVLEKHRVGLHFCRSGAEKYVQVDWIEDENGETGTATMKFKVRARRIRQNANGWELKDDAGSGIRGKPHDSSAFRFWACLQKDFSLNNSKPVDEIIQAAIKSNSGTYKCFDVRVWSKGNCPGKVRKSPGSSPRVNANLLIRDTLPRQAQQTKARQTQPRQTQTTMSASMALQAASLQSVQYSLPLPIQPIQMPTKKRSRAAVSHLNTDLFGPTQQCTQQLQQMNRPEQQSGKRIRVENGDSHETSLDDLMDQLHSATNTSSAEEIESIVNSLEPDVTPDDLDSSFPIKVGLDTDDWNLIVGLLNPVPSLRV